MIQHSHKQYKLAVVGAQHCLLCNSSVRIVDILQASAKALSYSELSKESGVALYSLYVYCQRLEQHGLVQRKKVLSGTPLRLRTEVVLVADIKLFDLVLVK